MPGLSCTLTNSHQHQPASFLPVLLLAFLRAAPTFTSSSCAQKLSDTIQGGLDSMFAGWEA
eukprot:3609581-Rhodomonas_salina.1